MCGDKVANRFGRPFHRKKERFELEDLKTGDHIVEERHFTYWHHMIVDAEEEQVYVIHYYNKRGPSGSGSVVCRDPFTYTKDKFYRIVYEDKECLPASEVLKKATARIGKKEFTYNTLTNNCEHFANECKTGKKECHQMRTPTEILGKSSISTIVSSIKEALGCTAKHIAESVPVTTFLVDALLIGFKAEAKFGEGKLTLNELAELIKEHFKSKPHKSSRRKGGAKFRLILEVIFETCFLYRDYSDTKAKFDERKLTYEEARKVIATRVVVAFLSLFGHAIWFYLDPIKWPTLGAFPDGWVLPVWGRIVAGAVGDYVVKEVAGASLALVY